MRLSLALTSFRPLICLMVNDESFCITPPPKHEPYSCFIMNDMNRMTKDRLSMSCVVWWLAKYFSGGRNAINVSLNVQGSESFLWWEAWIHWLTNTKSFRHFYYIVRKPSTHKHLVPSMRARLFLMFTPSCSLVHRRIAASLHSLNIPRSGWSVRQC